MAIRLLSGETIDGGATFVGKINITQNSGDFILENTGSGHASLTTGSSKDLNISSASGNVYINTNTTFSGTVAVNGDFLTVGDGDNANTLIQTRSSAGNISGIKIARGAGSWSSPQNNNFGLLVSDNGIELAKLTALGQNVTGRAPYLTIADGGAATFTGIVTTDKILVTKGQNVSHGASQLRISQEDTATSELRFYGANTSTAGTLRFLGSSSDGSVGGERLRIDSNGVLQLTETSASGFLNANGTSLELDINRNPETGAFGDTNKSHARINLTGASGGSFIIFNTASANNTTATEKMRINGSGNVGIGTQSPTAKLEIVTAVGADAIRMNYGQSADIFLGFNSANPRILLQDNSNIITHDFTSNANNYIVGSNLGIGTTAPSAKLDVIGDGSINTNLTVGAQSVTSSTTNYEYKLRVRGKNNYSDGTTWYGTYGQILLHSDTNMTGSARRFLITNALDNNKFAIVRSTDGNTDPVVNSTSTGVNSGTADFVITHTGNVGVGTASPSTKLHIDQPSNNRAGGLYIERNGSNYGLSAFVNSGGFGIIGSNGDFTTDILTMNLNNGNVGIGSSSPNAKLEVITSTAGFSGIIRNTNANNDSNGLLVKAGTQGTEYALKVSNTNDTQNFMSIKGSGNVGIGTTTPSSTFQVGGGTANVLQKIHGSGTAGIQIFTNSPSAGTKIASLEQYFSNEGFLGLYYNGTQTVRFRANGKSFINGGFVGIGTTNPYYELEVQGQGYFSSHLYAHCLGVGAATPNSLGVIRAAGDVIAYYSSDKRLKNNIIKIEKPLEKLEKINGYEFDWNDKQELYEGHDVGVVAQEIEEVYPQLVETRKDGYKAVKYEKLVPLLIESIKELKKEIDNIKNRSWQSDY